MYIYKITNKINGKIYIGQTIHKILIRFKYHIWCAKSGSGYNIHKAIRKYGAENFKIEEIDRVSKVEELNDKEIFYINELNSFNPNIGYNMTRGGDGVIRNINTIDFKIIITIDFDFFNIDDLNIIDVLIFHILIELCKVSPGGVSNYPISEIARIIKVTFPTAYRSLLKLEKMEFIKMSKSKNMRSIIICDK